MNLFWILRREVDGKSYVRYQVIGANAVAVPTHFYKVVVGEGADGSLDMEAYVMPNQKIPEETPVSSFMVSIFFRDDEFAESVAFGL